MQNLVLLKMIGTGVTAEPQEAKSQQSSLFASEVCKIFFRFRVCSVEQDEMCSRYLFQKEHKESPVLSSLKEEDGLVTSSQSDTLRISKSFYARLYDMKPTDCVASHSFLSSTTEVLDDSTWEILDQ
eukprot:g18675.t1